MHRLRWSCFSLAWVLFGSASSIAAQPSAESVREAPPTDTSVEVARQLFAEGLQFVEAEDWAGAEDRFRRVLSVKSSHVVSYNLASALRHLGRVTESSELLRVILRDATADATTHDAAQQLLSEIEPLIGSLTIRVSGETSGAELALDDQAARPERARADRLRRSRGAPHRQLHRNGSSMSGARSGRRRRAVAGRGRVRVATLRVSPRAVAARAASRTAEAERGGCAPASRCGSRGRAGVRALELVALGRRRGCRRGRCVGAGGLDAGRQGHSGRRRHHARRDQWPGGRHGDAVVAWPPRSRGLCLALLCSACRARAAAHPDRGRGRTATGTASATWTSRSRASRTEVAERESAPESALPRRVMLVHDGGPPGPLSVTVVRPTITRRRRAGRAPFQDLFRPRPDAILKIDLLFACIARSAHGQACVAGSGRRIRPAIELGCGQAVALDRWPARARHRISGRSGDVLGTALVDGGQRAGADE